MFNQHLIVSVFMGLCFSLSLQKAEAVDLMMYGSLILSPTCKINNDEVIRVDFGNTVLTDKVDGVNYKKVVPYHIICSGSAGSLPLYLTVISSAIVSYDTAAVETNISGLAVSLALDNKALTINTPFKMEVMNYEPELTAVLVKQPGMTLSPGTFFTKTAVLQAFYQ